MIRPADGCWHCAKSAPSSSVVGWVTVTCAGAAGWERRFCSLLCLLFWGQARLGRLADAVLEAETHGPEVPT